MAQSSVTTWTVAGMFLFRIKVIHALMSIYCQLSGGHKTKKHSGSFLVPFYWICFWTNSAVCSFLFSFFLYLIWLTIEWPIRFLQKITMIYWAFLYRVKCINTEQSELWIPRQQFLFLTPLKDQLSWWFYFLHFAGFVFLRIFLYLLFSLEWLQVDIYLTIKLITTSLFIWELTRL